MNVYDIIYETFYKYIVNNNNKVSKKNYHQKSKLSKVIPTRAMIKII